VSLARPTLSAKSRLICTCRFSSNVKDKYKMSEVTSNLFATILQFYPIANHRLCCGNSDWRSGTGIRFDPPGWSRPFLVIRDKTESGFTGQHWLSRSGAHWRIYPATADHEAASRIINDDVLRHRLHRRVHTVIESGAVPPMLRWPGGAPIHSIVAGPVAIPSIFSREAGKTRCRTTRSSVWILYPAGKWPRHS